MPNTRLLRWIEQAEARQVTAEARFRQAPALSWRQLARDAIAGRLSRLMPEWPMPQAQPALIRRQDSRRQVRRDDGGGRC
jgi:hypothetical protein